MAAIARLAVIALIVLWAFAKPAAAQSLAAQGLDSWLQHFQVDFIMFFADGPRFVSGRFDPGGGGLVVKVDIECDGQDFVIRNVAAGTINHVPLAAGRCHAVLEGLAHRWSP
jgi:hypothetical protein